MKGFVGPTVKKKAQFSGNLGGPDLRRWTNSWRWWVAHIVNSKGQNCEVTESCLWLHLTSIPTFPTSMYLRFPVLSSLPFFHFLECPLYVMHFSSLLGGVQRGEDKVFPSRNMQSNKRDMIKVTMEMWFSVVLALRQKYLGTPGRKVREASRASEMRTKTWRKNRCLLDRWWTSSTQQPERKICAKSKKTL